MNITNFQNIASLLSYNSIKRQCKFRWKKDTIGFKTKGIDSFSQTLNFKSLQPNVVDRI